MATLPLILRFRGLAFLRALRQSAFSLLVIAPLVLGVLAAVADRFLPLLAPTLRTLLERDVDGPGAVGYVIALLAMGTGLSAAFDALFPRRGTLLLLDLAPVAGGARFVTTWLARVRGQVPVVLGIWVLALLMQRHGESIAGAAWVWLLRLSGAGLVLAGLELLAVLLLVRLRAWRPLVVLGLGAGLVIAALTPESALGSVVLFPWAVPAAQMSRVLTEAIGIAGTVHAAAKPLVTVVAAWVAALSSGVVAVRWQRRYRQSALAQSHGGTRGGGRWIARLAGRLASAPRALLVRDLLLVARRFSPAVDVAALSAVVWLAFAAVVPTLEIVAFWRHRAPMLLIALSVLQATALVPFVLRHQLPRAWLERTAGVPPTAIWRAKLWLARALAVPPLVIGAGILMLRGPGGPLDRLADVGTVALVAWMVATLIGLVSFEIAERPFVGLVFGALVAGAFAALSILYRTLLPAWVVGYALLASTVAERATRRVRFTEVAR